MNVEKLEKSCVKITIDVKKEEFDAALDKSFEIMNNKVTLKGFRKGHIPRKIYEANFGVESLYEEAMNALVPDKYYDAIMEAKLNPVGHPSFNINWETVKQGFDFSFEATVPVRPEVKLGQYKNIEAKKANSAVSDEEIETEINKLLSNDAKIVTKENEMIEAHDIAIFDFDGSVDGVHFDGGKAEKFELEIMSHQFIPGFEEQMIGMKVGEERDLKVKFPENYQAKDLAGKDAIFHVLIHEIKQKEKKELNDEFVKSLNRDGVTTVVELKESIKNSIEKQKEQNEKNRIIDTLVDTATNNATFEVPDALVDSEKEQMISNVKEQAKKYNMELDMFLSLNGVKKEDFLKTISEQALKRVKYELVIAEIMQAEKIEATEEEINDKYEELAKMYNMTLDKVKESINPQAISYNIAYEKTINFLMDNADLK